MRPHDPRIAHRPSRPNRPEIRAVRRELPPPPGRRGRPWLLAVVASVAIVGLSLLGWRASPTTKAEEPPRLVTAQYGGVEEALEIDALVIREEEVVTAPSSGTVRRLAAEGERVRVGMSVVEIGPASAETPEPPSPAQAGNSPGTSTAQREYDRLTAEIFRLAVAVNQAKYAGETEKAASLEEQLDLLARRQAALIGQLDEAAWTVEPAPPLASLVDPLTTQIQAGTGGIILYEVDGLETILTPEASEGWSIDWLRSLPYPDRKQVGDGTVAAGQPLFKVVHDTDLELLAVVPAHRLTEARRTLIQQEGVTLRIGGGEQKLSAHVKAIKEGGEELLLHLTVPLPSVETLKVRRLRTTMLMEVYEGIVLPRSAIDVQNGLQGIWVHEAGSYRFVPVRVVGGNTQEVAVTGEVPLGTQVLGLPPPPKP